MCTVNQLNEISREIISAYKNVYGDKIVAIILYGSYARGDSDSNSDVDITAVVKGERRELQDKLKIIWDVSSEISMDYNVIISPTVIPEDEYEKYKNELPYYRNIMTEGIKIG